MDDTVNHAREQGYVATMFGRRRYLPDIRHSNFNLRSFAERTAINTPIQGTAADIIKIAMLKVEQALFDAGAKEIVDGLKDAGGTACKKSNGKRCFS